MTTKIYHNTVSESPYTDDDLDQILANVTIASSTYTTGTSIDLGMEDLIGDINVDYAFSSAAPQGYVWNTSTASPNWNTISVGGGGGGGIAGGWPYGGLTDAKVTVNKGLHIDGDADLTIGDMSLKETLAALAERLNVLIPDTRLEREYEELRQAREHYEYVRKKLQTLEALKNTPVEPKI